jgi:hypothetical protein
MGEEGAAMSDDGWRGGWHGGGLIELDVTQIGAKLLTEEISLYDEGLSNGQQRMLDLILDYLGELDSDHWERFLDRLVELHDDRPDKPVWNLSINQEGMTLRDWANEREREEDTTQW